jgi:type VI secretion system secreted protein VgrG
MGTQFLPRIGQEVLVGFDGGDLPHLATGGAHRVHTGQAIGVLGGAVKPGTEAAGTGLTLMAAQGDVELQAQSDALQVAAKGPVTIQSAHGHIDWAAAKKIVISTAGGASITIEGGDITFECPGKLLIHAGIKSFVGPETYAQGKNTSTGSSRFDELLVLLWPFDSSPIAHRHFEIVRGDGTVIRGQTDAAGQTGLQKSDFFEDVQLRLLKEI